MWKVGIGELVREFTLEGYIVQRVSFKGVEGYIVHEYLKVLVVSP